MLGGFTPLLSNYEWPVALRVYHTIEILFSKPARRHVDGLYPQPFKNERPPARLILLL